ncbi:glutathione transferase family protein [Thraustotheca clavata]|uniref:Glutathione transferase family protein n=1 Tax=Thraustotheca clavata TaxID=74557 RepID=A0A1V9ZXF7_9STRA|nr:glutathione transferase family protein [Thraustotheca clavata]
MSGAFEIVDYNSLSESDLASLKQDGKVHLFNNLVCPFGQRALWSAVETGVKFRMIDVSLVDMPSSYVEKFNRYHTVPFLLDNGNAIFESAIIAQFLDVKYNNGKLHLRDNPEQAALAQLAQAKFEIGAFYGYLRNQDPSKKEEFENEIHETLSELEKIYREHAAEFRSKGPYLLGDKLSSAEINIIPFFYRFQIVLKHYRGFDVLAGYPLLTAAYYAAIERNAFKITVKEPEYYIKAYAKYANP